jgi:N-acetyl-gamma-glutamyl-phosphate reductase
MLRAGIAGGSGYGGLELIQILMRHPQVDLVWLSSQKHAGKNPGEVFPHLRGLLKVAFSRMEELQEADLDLLFLALPHGEAMKVLPTLPQELRIVDLSGDFRLHEPQVFEEYYGFPMTAAALQRQFVYGLPEINRNQIRSATRIANPGCFATATLLALYPLYEEGWIAGPVYVDSKTGSSGSGRTPSEKTHHPRRSQSLFPYKPFRHQHLPEMRQILSRPSNPLIFQPHSAPLVRGIFASHYMQLETPVGLEEVQQLFIKYYGEETFIRWTPSCPDVSSVQHSNFVDLGAATENGFLVLWSTLDNLQKGAAGQAVQNMNIAFGFEETMALTHAPAFP